MYNWKAISINGWYFRNQTPLEIIQLVKKAGFSACEFTGSQLGSLSKKELLDLKDCAQKDGVKILDINTACDMFQFSRGNFLSENEAHRKKAIQYITKTLDICAFLNIPKLILDTGTTVPYSQSREQQEKLWRQSWIKISEYAEQKKVALSLIIVPYRRVINSKDGFYYSDYPREELFAQSRRTGAKRVGWVFDTANEMAGRKNMHGFSLAGEVQNYLKQGLDVVYLANHPGPMTRTFRRALYHNCLREGYYTADDYRNLFTVLKKYRSQGQISLHLSVRCPSVDELKKERLYWEKLIRNT
ncbi:MAG: sugar phosphate isomerase/epimerase [Candidatus Omnitrophota bacterium]